LRKKPNRREIEDEEDAPHGRLRSWVMQHPRDAVCLFLAVAAVGIITANALFWQTARHPAPIFAEIPGKPRVAAVPLPPVKRQPTAQTTASVQMPAVPVNPAGAMRPQHLDPIAELLEPSNRTIAVQRALADFGYGQIKPTGTIGPETKAAIERFERERKLPVTGQISDRLMRELTVLKGGSL
jgi:hypothetical protein